MDKHVDLVALAILAAVLLVVGSVHSAISHTVIGPGSIHIRPMKPIIIQPPQPPAPPLPFSQL